MSTIQLTSWLVLVAGFGFGLSDRWLSADLQSVGIAACFLIPVIVLYPKWR